MNYPTGNKSVTRKRRNMDSALDVEDLCKAYQVVKKNSNAREPGHRWLNDARRLLLGETFDAFGARQVTPVAALDRVTFTIEPGQVVGLFGKNGSGKTTLLSILGGVFPADSGSVRCFGYDLRTEPRHVRNHVIPIFGWLDAITWAFTGRQNIEKFLLMHHVEPKPLAGQIDELAHAIDLGDRLDDRAARYSQGMRIKLQIIAAILLQRTYGRSLLLLDEPFIGLDLVTQRFLRRFVGEELRRSDFSMLLATHQPDDIEALCDEVIVLDRGRVLVKDSVVNLRRMVRQRESVQIIYAPAVEGRLPDLSACACIDTHRTIRRNGHVESTLSVEDSSATLSWLLPQILQGNSRLLSVQTQPMRFSDVLLALIEDNS